MRTGLIAKKVGMTSIFDFYGFKYAVTLLKINDCQVVGHKTLKYHGYNALIIGVDNVNISKVSKPIRRFFIDRDINPKKKLKEFRISENYFCDIGTYLYVDYFNIGSFIDVTGVTIGKGFAGSMKRHHFKGLEASHGVSISHRSHGSTGGRQDPGKVFKGKKMAGHLGCVQVTVQNINILNINKDLGLIIVKGNVPGHNGSYVYIKDSVKKIL